MDHSNRRSAPRAGFAFYVNKFLDGIPHLTWGRDISPSGIYLERLLEPAFAGRRVGLQFELPGSREIVYAEGETVRHVDGGEGFGIRFTLIAAAHRRLIEQYVTEEAA